ncbi:MAG: agmatinase [Thermoplasmatales archaeon]
MASRLKFCDTIDDYAESRYVIFGVPFDSTVSFRAGEKLAPNEIRKASYNMESYSLYRGVDLKNAAIFDDGDLDEHHETEDMLEEVFSEVDKIVSDGKFPIMLGGEHSISLGALRRLKCKTVFIDAHTDFRDSYLGNRYSHACVARRVSEIVGKDNIVSLGIRSVSPEEVESGTQKFFTSFQLRKESASAMEYLNNFAGSPVYLSIDFDGFDPAFAPGVGTPEPFGLDPLIILDLMDAIGSKLVGFDLTEISPVYDNGNTSMLAARIVQEVVSFLEKSRK